jgi:tetratricopeptide (TPR) repeat protein
VVASLASAIALLLTTAAVVATIAALRFEDLAQQKAVQQRQAEHQLQQALDSVDRMLTRVADERLENVPFMEEVRRGLYEDALAVYRQILARSDDDPAVRLELAVAERRVAGILEKLGRHDEARTAAESAAAKLSVLCHETPPVPRADLELAHLLIFQARMVNAESPTAIRQLAEAAELLRPHAATDRNAGLDLGRCLTRLALLQRDGGHRDDATEPLDEAERVFATLQEGRAPDRDIAIAYAKYLGDYGNFHRSAGEWERAEAKYRRVMDVTGPLLEGNRGDAEARLVHSLAIQNLAVALMYQGQAQAASDRFRDAVEIQQRLVGEFPLFPEYRIRLADTLMSASGACLELNDHEHAVKALEAAIETLEYLTENWPDVRKYHGTLGGTLSNLAYLLSKPGASPDALDYAESLASRAIEEQRLALERPDEPNQFLLKHYFVLVMVQGQRGRVREALATCEEALRIGEVLGNKFPENPEIQLVIAEVRRLKGVGEGELKKLSAPPQEHAADEQ